MGWKPSIRVPPGCYGQQVTERAERATPRPVEPATSQPTKTLLSRQYIGVIIAIGGVLLMAFMDGPVAVYALPTIQDELGLSNAGRAGGYAFRR